MIEGRIIVAVGSAWDYDPTCKHHLMKVLAKHNRVVWINYHGSRRPRLCLSDIRTAFQKLTEVARGVRQVNEQMTQVTPLVVPGAKSRFFSSLHEKLLVAQVRRAVAAARGNTRKPVQVWSFAPDVPFLAGSLDEEAFVYYCPDEFAEFEGYDARHIAEAERQQLERADVVFTTSTRLQDAKRRIRQDSVLMPHGVNHEMFAGSWKEKLTPPPEIADLDGPVFGFFGLVHHWFDVDLLARVARLRPSYNFVVIGEIRTDCRQLAALPNVHLLGRRPHETLPACCAGFTAGMMLFRRTAMTAYVNPIKMLEYLAAGLPVISTSLPEAAGFSPYVTVAPTPETFAEGCDAALTDKRLRDRPTISKTAEGQSWESRAEAASEIVMTRIHETASGPLAQNTTAPGRSAPSIVDLPTEPANRRPAPTEPIAPSR